MSVEQMGCTSPLHERRNCDRAFCNDEITEAEWCPNCLHWANSRMREVAYRRHWCDRCREHHSLADGHQLAPHPEHLLDENERLREVARMAREVCDSEYGESHDDAAVDLLRTALKELHR